ncbi:SDR family oxidoreductase [Metabacillus sp. RGM 3146]|uniref:SDR family oxidoreductase n=1 Tax=Metabacillus sp. RGM 3146 TaxID=3401092 RepID=UPI003B9BE9CC
MKEILRKDNLGIGQEMRERLQNEVTHVFHLAAINDLGVKREAAYKVNVIGRNMTAAIPCKH